MNSGLIHGRPHFWGSLLFKSSPHPHKGLGGGRSRLELLLSGGGSGTAGSRHNFHSSMGVGVAGGGMPVEKSSLAKLRRNTGYSFSRCKEALEKHQNDLKAAESWLRSEAQTHGWEKATKLQGRATAQGLISVLASPHNAVMLEINCETDFVARNKKFQALVQKVTQACFVASEESKKDSASSPNLFKNPLNDSELYNVPIRGGGGEGGHSTKDEIALSIGDIGENIKPRRGLFLQSTEPNLLLSGYTHPASPEAEKQRLVQFGKFGAIVAYRVGGATAKNTGLVEEIGRQLCQHVVGMNPVEIGSMDEPPPKRKVSAAPPTPPPPKTQEGDEGQVVDELDALSVTTSEPEVEDETVLLNQEFLLDPEFTVREFLIQNNVQVVDFVRFECGENLDKS